MLFNSPSRQLIDLCPHRSHAAANSGDKAAIVKQEALFCIEIRDSISLDDDFHTHSGIRFLYFPQSILKPERKITCTSPPA